MGRVFNRKAPIKQKVKKYPERGVVWEREHESKRTRFDNSDIRSQNKVNSVDEFGPRKKGASWGTPERARARGLRKAGHLWPYIHGQVKIPVRTMKQ